MSNSDKAMKELEKLADYYGNDIEDWEIGIYIKQQEQLAKDVARYFELLAKNFDNPLEAKEYVDLQEKLSKVGKL